MNNTLVRSLGQAAFGLGMSATMAFAQAEGAPGTDDAIIISHGYSNFGELKYPEGFAHLAYVNPDAPKGGEISTWSQSNFDSFNPYTRKGVAEFTGATLIFEDILMQTADDPYGLYCYLCETMEYPKSRDWVIFNLREDVTFSDGTPMTAEDIAFSFNLVLEQGITEYREVVKGYIAGVEVLGPHRIRFDFTEDAPRRDVIGFAGASNAWSKKWFEETGTRLDDSSDRPFMGTGPYVLSEVDMGRSVTYAKDPDWWGAEHPLSVGRWNFDAISVEVFTDSAAAMEAFKAGVYTLRVENSSKEWATSYNFPAVEKGWVNVETLPDGNVSSAQGFVFNLRRERWQDPRVRDAVAMLLNFEWANESLFYGLYSRPYSFWGGSELAAEGPPSEAELALLEPLVAEGLLPESILTDEAAVPAVADVAQNAPSRGVRREAMRLLNEAGWVAGEDGMVRNEAGQTLDLVVIQTSPAFDRIVNPYVSNLREAGINAKLERVDTAQYVERRRSGDWDLTNHSPGQGFEPGTGLKQWFASSTAADSSRNIMALENPAVDRLVDTAIAAQTLDELRSAVHALDRVLRSIGFWIPQWEKQEHWVAYWDQYDHPEEIPPLSPGTLDFWWYDAEGAERLREAGAL